MTEKTIHCASDEEFHAYVKHGLAEFTKVVDSNEPHAVYAVAVYEGSSTCLRVGNPDAMLVAQQQLGANVVKIDVVWHVLVFALGLLLGVWL